MWKKRSYEEEIMDDFDIQGPVIDQTLKELAIINKWLGGNQVTLIGLNHYYEKHHQGETLSIVDMGCGGGDMLQLIYHWAQKKGVQVELTGMDANPAVIEYAVKNSKGLPIHFHMANVFEPLEGLQFDLALGTLFFHHFKEDEILRLFEVWKGSLKHGWIINDLHRHPAAYQSIKLLTKLFSKSDMVKSDGPLSVKRAFLRMELEDLLKKAEFSSYHLSWHWAFRWLIQASY